MTRVLAPFAGYLLFGVPAFAGAPEAPVGIRTLLLLLVALAAITDTAAGRRRS